MSDTIFIPIVTACALFLAAYGFGAALLCAVDRRRVLSPGVFVLFSLGIGLGIIAHLALLMGLLGLARASGWLIAAGSAGVLARTRSLSKPMTVAGEDARAPRGAARYVLFALALCLIAAGAITFISALAPPVDYDVLEYHIAGPMRWLRLGRVGAFPGNIYANMPGETEMLYTAAMSAAGWIAPAMAQHVPGILHWMFGAGALGVAWAIMKRLGVGVVIRLLVMLLLALHPVFFMVSGHAYIDLAVMFWVGLGILAHLFVVPFVVPPSGGESQHNSNAEDINHSLSTLHLKVGLQTHLCFIFLALAVCAKLTAVTLYAIPFFLIIIPAMALRLNYNNIKNSIPCAVKLSLFAAATLGAVYLPWAARAWLATGNPFFPALSGVYHNSFWSAAQTQLWLTCHQQTEFWRADYWHALAMRLNQPGYWAMLPCLLAFLPNRRGQQPNQQPAQHPDGRRALALFAMAAYGAWCLAHGSADRFILPALMAAAPVSAAVLSDAIDKRRWVIVALWGALAMTAFPGAKMDLLRFGYLKPWTALPDAASAQLWQAQHVQGAPQGARAALWANEQLPRDARLLLVYEARFALFDRACEGNTIFDRSALLDALEGEPSTTPADIRAALRRKGFTHVLINDNDLHLFTRMYLGKHMEKAFSPLPSPLSSPSTPQPPIPDPNERGLRPAEFIQRLPDPRPEDFFIPFMTDPRYPSLRKALLQFLGECRQNASHVELNNQGQGIVWIYDL